MRVQAFIPNWPGPKQHADQLMQIISAYCPTTILNDPNDYFNAQWARARESFTGDVLLWVMADVTLPEDFAGMYATATKVMERGDVGWYAPDIAWTSYIYDKADLRPVGGEHSIYNDVYEVPNTDSLYFMISRDVIDAMPHIDPKVSFMWGMDITAIATARLRGLKVVRDYKFKAHHPNSTGYDIPRAGNEMIPLFNAMAPRLRAAAHQVEADVRRLRRGPCASL
jgi:hypothetical protein